jgi:hypothetical protein
MRYSHPNLSGPSSDPDLQLMAIAGGFRRQILGHLVTFAEAISIPAGCCSPSCYGSSRGAHTDIETNPCKKKRSKLELPMLSRSTISREPFGSVYRHEPRGPRHYCQEQSTRVQDIQCATPVDYTEAVARPVHGALMCQRS